MTRLLRVKPQDDPSSSHFTLAIEYADREEWDDTRPDGGAPPLRRAREQVQAAGQLARVALALGPSIQAEKVRHGCAGQLNDRGDYPDECSIFVLDILNPMVAIGDGCPQLNLSIPASPDRRRVWNRILRCTVGQITGDDATLSLATWRTAPGSINPTAAAAAIRALARGQLDYWNGTGPRRPGPQRNELT